MGEGKKAGEIADKTLFWGNFSSRIFSGMPHNLRIGLHSMLAHGNTMATIASYAAELEAICTQLSAILALQQVNTKSGINLTPQDMEDLKKLVDKFEDGSLAVLHVKDQILVVTQTAEGVAQVLTDLKTEPPAVKQATTPESDVSVVTATATNETSVEPPKLSVI